MRPTYSSVGWLFFLGCVTGCAPAINQKNAERYEVAGAQAQAAGDWETARLAFARAMVNARSGGMPTRVRAVFHYEYGRSLGVTCFFDEAERELLVALELDEQSKQPRYLALNELARLNLDQRNFLPAVNYFERGLKEMEATGAKQRAPVAYAEMLDEHALALDQTGRRADANALRAEASQIRLSNPGRSSTTDRTPYGTRCSVKK